MGRDCSKKGEAVVNCAGDEVRHLTRPIARDPQLGGREFYERKDDHETTLSTTSKKGRRLLVGFCHARTKATA